MAKVHSASRFTAIVAAIFGGSLACLFHYNRGPISVLIGGGFGAVSALVAYGLVYRVTRSRVGIKKPVLGPMLGALLGLATFLVSVIGHTVFFPGQGSFLASLIPISFIGLGMFGWLVAIIGACVGVFCERRYFA